MKSQRESRAANLTAKAMEAVKTLDRSRDELPGVRARNVQTVMTGTGEALPGPVALRIGCRSVVPYNR